MQKNILYLFIFLCFSRCTDEVIDPDKYVMPGMLMATRTSEGILLDWNFHYLAAYSPTDIEVSNIYMPGAVSAEKIEILYSPDDTLHFSRIYTGIPGGQFLFTAGESGRDYYFRMRASAKGVRASYTQPIHVQFRENPEIRQLVDLPNDYNMQLGNFSFDQSSLIYGRYYQWGQDENCCSDYSAMSFNLPDQQEMLLLPRAYYPVWSPAGRQIAFHYDFQEDSYSKNIGLYDLENDTVVQLTHGENWFELPTWHPEGNSIIFLSAQENSNLYNVFSIDPVNAVIQLFSDNPHLKVIYERPSFSPDGKKLAFTSLSENSQTGIYELNIENDQIKPLMESIWYDRHPSYSPDGKFLAFHSFRTGRDEIWIRDRNTNALHQLTGRLEENISGDLVWGPDGKHLYFKMSRNDEFGIFYTIVDF